MLSRKVTAAWHGGTDGSGAEASEAALCQGEPDWPTGLCNGYLSFGKGGSWLVFYSEGNNCAEARAANPDSSKTLPISWLVLAAGHTQLQGWRSFQIVEKLLCAKAYWKYRKTSQYGPEQQGDHRKLRGCYVENAVLHQTGDQIGSVSFYIYGKMRSLNLLLELAKILAVDVSMLSPQLPVGEFVGSDIQTRSMHVYRIHLT
ncbi:hypothetical protein TURU_159912 [Turdus rufiventris]|nr:hypothetical protein TURU_159912 [Turdus rufiventris]